MRDSGGLRFGDQTALQLARATWPLARMARTAKTPFHAMLALRARLTDLPWERGIDVTMGATQRALAALLRRATAEVETLLLIGTGSSEESLTGKRRRFFDALKTLGRPATIEDIVMEAGGKDKKVNSDDRATMRELEGSLIEGMLIRSTPGEGRKLFELAPVDDSM